LGLLLVTLFGTAALGSLLLRRIPWHNALESYLFSQALGLAILSSLVLAMGAAGLYQTGFFWILWAALGTLSIHWFILESWRSRLKSAAQELRASWPATGKFWLRVPILLLVLTSFIMAFVPEIFYDALVYHLGVPRLYLLAHKLFNVPMLHSKFPLMIQMLYLYGLALADDLLPKLIHWSLGICLILAFVSCGKRHGRTEAGWLAAVIFLSMPMAQMNWWTSGMDVGLSFFAFLSIYAMMNAVSQPNEKRPWLILCAVFSGFSMASKYTAVIIPAGLLIALLVAASREEKPIKIFLTDGAWIVGIGTLIFAPWLVKNWVFTRNPVYPFLSRIFGTPGLSKIGFQHFMGENKGQTPQTLIGWLTLPWNLTFVGNWGALSFPGPILLGLAPAPFLLKKRSRPDWFQPLIVFLLVSLTGILSFNRLLRYSMPVLAGISWLLGWAAWTAMENAGKILRTGLSTALSLLAVFNIFIGWTLIQGGYQPLDVLTGAETRRDYMSYTHPGLDPYPATAMFDAAQQSLPPGSRLMLIGDEKVADCRMSAVTSGVFDEAPIVTWSREAKNPDDLFSHFKMKGVTHLIVNLQEARRTYGYGYMNWDDESLARFSLFWNSHVRLLGQQSFPEKLFPQSSIPLYLYAVLPVAEAVQRGGPPENPILWLEQNEIKKARGSQAAAEFSKRLQNLALHLGK
jgi:hypothetical protein